MIQKIFDSIFVNFKQKSKNPFLGTLIIVWVFRNWDLIYALFYFDKALKFEQRIDWIKAYYPNFSFYWEMLFTVLESILILIITYTLLNLSRYIINRFEKQVTPWIYKMTDKNSVVLKTDHERLKKQIVILEERTSVQRQERAKAEIEADNWKTKYQESMEEIANSKQSADNNEENVNQVTYTKEDDVPDGVISKIYSNLSNENKINDLKQVLETISSGESMLKTDPDIRHYAFLGLISLSNTYSGGMAEYKITPLGEKFKNGYLI